MLRICALACATVLFGASQSLAQGISFGVKGGVNVASTDVSGSSGDESYDPRFGIVAGGFVTMPVASWLDVQVEGLYSEKGSRVSVVGIDTKLVLDYVEVPILGRVRLGRLFYAAAGPAMGLRVGAKTRFGFGGTTEEIDVSDEVERFDLGIAMGGGVRLGPIELDGRYTLGLTDIDKDKTDDTRIKNRAISVTAGFRF